MCVCVWVGVCVCVGVNACVVRAKDMTKYTQNSKASKQRVICTRCSEALYVTCMNAPRRDAAA